RDMHSRPAAGPMAHLPESGLVEPMNDETDSRDARFAPPIAPVDRHESKTRTITPALRSRTLHWLCTTTSTCVSVGMATWAAILGFHAGVLPSEALTFAARLIPTMMFWFLPLWAPDVSFAVGTTVSKWLRLVCGAIGVGIGLALILGLAAARAKETF